MSGQPPPDEFPSAVRVIGVIYLTFWSGCGGGVFLLSHPESIYCRIAVGVAVVAGLILAVAARIPDPAARPIRWGLLWLVFGFVAGPCVAFGLGYLVFEVIQRL